MKALGDHALRMRILHRMVLFAPTLAILSFAQTISPAQAPMPNLIQRLPNPFGEYEDAGPVTEDRRMEALNVERRKSMVSDATKLVRLAQELDQEVAANASEGLTPKELREVAEIEKLARNVREKMARSFGAGPVFHEPAPFPRGGSDRYPGGP